MRASFLALVAAVTLTSTVALADNDEEARAAMRRGLAAFARHEHEAALAEYRRAMELAPDANLPRRYAAEVLVELERYEEAIAEYETYLAIKPDVSDAADVRARIESARSKIDGAVTITSSPGGADVFVDGRETKAGVTPVASLRLRRGPHRIVVKLAGRKDVEFTPTVKGGETLALACDFGAPAKAPPADAPPPRRDTSSPIGWILLGSGAAVLAGSLATDVLVLRPAYDDFQDKRGRGDPTALDAKDKVTTMQTVLVVTYATGAVAALAGGAFLLWPKTASRAVVAPMVAPGTAGVVVTGRTWAP